MLANTEDTQDLNSNEDSYAGLVSMIDLSQGMMVLIIASCPSEVFRDELIERYEKELAAEIPSYRIKLDRSEPSLRAALEKLVTDQPELKQPKASAVISVTGAESLMSIPVRSEETNSALDRFFGYLQWTREGLREFPFPIVLWVTPKILKQFSAKAPDFWSWRGGVFQFSSSPTLTRSFVTDKRTNSQTFLEPSINDLALKELLVRAEEIERQDPLSSSLAILFNRLGQAYASRPSGNNLEAKEKAIEYYQKALLIQTRLDLKSARVKTLMRLANLFLNLNRYQNAKELYEESLILATELGNQSVIADNYQFLGYVNFKQGNWDQADVLYQRSLQILMELRDRAGMANSWKLLGDIACNRGDYEKAESLYHQSLTVYTELGDRAGMARYWGVLGDIARSRGDYETAESLYHQCLAVETELGDRAGMASSWGVLGDIARNRGDYEKAESLYHQCLAVETELGDRAGIAVIWGSLGENELARGNLETAETWLKKALVVMEELQMVDYIAETNLVLAQLHRSKQNNQKAQEHYEIAHQLYTQLGAKKELEKIEANWNSA